jgi:hypothetical protein
MKISGVAAKAAMALAAFATVVPAQAASPLDDAEKLRRLDIMLMVTGLRCRTTADNFNAEYGRFTTNHLATLNAAGAQLKAQMAARHGPAGANRALDKFSTTMANTYGQGHPWLSCAELKAATASLAQVRGRATLLEAADQLLAGGRGAEFAIARRR